MIQNEMYKNTLNNGIAVNKQKAMVLKYIIKAPGNFCFIRFS